MILNQPLTYSEIVLPATCLSIFILGMLFGIWVGFRMRGKAETGPAITEPFVKPKRKDKPFARFGMNDYIADAFDLEERPNAIPIKKPGA